MRRATFLTLFLAMGCGSESAVTDPQPGLDAAVSDGKADGGVVRDDAGDDAADAFEVGADAAQPAPPSCADGLTCASGVSCCDSNVLLAGTFPMGRATSGPENEVCSTWASGKCFANEQPEHSATVSAFRLDTYEVTVARFRKFVAGYPANRPKSDTGAHPKIAGSGWQTGWDVSLPATQAELIANLNCENFGTWTASPDVNESKPINCLNWYEAFAFCAWDGGRLPTEAEWEYAAAGGSENRVLPWGTTAPDNTRAVYGCLFTGTSSCEPADVPAVGSAPAGISRWGQQDMAGSVSEWVLDWFQDYPASPNTDYANVTPGTLRVYRGGHAGASVDRLRAASRVTGPPTQRLAGFGVRCARGQ